MEGTRPGPPAAAGARGTNVPAEAARSGPSPAVRLLLIALGAVALLVAIVFAVRYLAYASTHETTDDATIDSDQVQVTPKIAERVRSIEVDTNQRVHRGQLLVELDDADARNRYASAVAAVNAQRATTRAARENVGLTRATQEAQNQQAFGAIDQAKASVASAALSARSAQQQIAVSQAAVDAARAQLQASQDAIPGARQNLRRADADLRRTQSLVSTGDVAASNLDADRATYEQARSNYAQSEANVAASGAQLSQAVQKLNAQYYATSSTQAQVGVQQANLTIGQGRLAESAAPGRISTQLAQAEAQQAQIGSLRAQLKTASDNLSYTRIFSPIDGYVGQKNVEIGQTVAPGESLFTLIPANNVYITANYKETQIGRMRVGNEVDISVDAYRGTKFVGHVSDLGPASQNKFSLVPAQNATGNFVKVTQRLPIRILFDRVENGNLEDYALRPGLSVETSVKVK